MRVLYLATDFPRPHNPQMGIWAELQAQAMLRAGMDVRVISMNAWIPRILGFVKRARGWAWCPKQRMMGELPVAYPRWPLYPVEPFKGWGYRSPQRQLILGWRFASAPLLRVARDWKPDVVLAQHALPNGWMAAKLKAETGIPFAVADFDFVEVRDCDRFPARRDAMKRVANEASMMIATSSPMERDYQRLFPGVATATAYFGANSIPEQIRSSPRPSELVDKTVIFCAANFFPRKAQPVLIRAFAKIAARHPNAVLRLAGDGPERPAVEAAIRETGMEGRVKLLGRLPHGEVMRNMVWCHVFALVGWDEPFATVYMEAMSAARPIVCASDGGINDVLRDSVHGRSVPPRDVEATAAALDELLTDASLRTRMGKAAFELFESGLTWDANARRMQELLELAIGRR